MDPIPISSDADLVEELKNHRPEAWYSFVTNHSQRLKKIMKFNGVPDIDIDDAQNELLYKILIKLDTYEPTKGLLSTWITTIAKNHARDWIKTKDFKERQETNSLDKENSLLINDKKTDQSESNSSVQNQKIDNILTQHFNERQLALISLRITNGRPWKDVYEIMVPQEYPSKEAARKECSRLLIKLRDLLEPFIK